MANRVKINPEYIGKGTLSDLKQELMEDPDFRLGWKLHDMAVEIGRLVSEMRKKAGLTQAQLAEKLGVSQALIARLESDHPERMPTFATIARVVKMCGYEMEGIFR